MKSFFASLCASLVALIVFFVGGAFLLFVTIALIAASGEKTPTLADGTYLVLDLTAVFTDAPREFEREPFGGFWGRGPGRLQLREVLRALQRAESDDRVAGLFLTGNVVADGYGSGFAAMRELRAGLEAFRAAGKPIVAYGDLILTRDFYLMSTADELVLNPFGFVAMPGLAAQPLFFADAFEKWGIGVQVLQTGAYKSAGEQFVRRDLSPENRAQLQELIDELWEELRGATAASRRLEAAELQAIVESVDVPRGEIALRTGLVDRLAYFDEVLADLRTRTGVEDPSEPFRQMTLGEYAKLPGAPLGRAGRRERGRVAVVYAEGEIVDGESERGWVGGDTFARELRRLRHDDDVRAVVLRVNSPGGSATASEAILREMRLLRESKPVVVSMGSYATSGGYWISTAADRVFAEPTTITGSIGVFGVLFNVEQLAGKIGLTTDTVKTGRFADATSPMRPKTDEEMKAFERVIEWFYSAFLDRVAEGRKLDRRRVEELAGGRVWTGRQAKEFGLIDEIGGLTAAIAYAAERAGLGERPRLVEFPRTRQFSEVIDDLLNRSPREFSRTRHPLAPVWQDFERTARSLQRFNDPHHVYARMPVDIVVR